MAKRPKSKRKPAKRGPKAEILRIDGDPQAALDKLLLKQDRDAKRKFDAAQTDGDDALKRHDRIALSDAISRETQAVDEHISIIKKKKPSK